MNTQLPRDLSLALNQFYRDNPTAAAIDLFYSAEGQKQPEREKFVAQWWREKKLATDQTPAARMERLLRKFPYLFDEDDRGPRGICPTQEDIDEAYAITYILTAAYGHDNPTYKKSIRVLASIQRLAARHGISHDATNQPRLLSQTPEGAALSKALGRIRDSRGFTRTVNAFSQGLASDGATLPTPVAPHAPRVLLVALGRYQNADMCSSQADGHIDDFEGQLNLKCPVIHVATPEDH